MVLIQYYSTYSVLYRFVGRLGFSRRVSASYSIVIALRLLIFMCPTNLPTNEITIPVLTSNNIYFAKSYNVNDCITSVVCARPTPTANKVS